jgi:hypothetical protein
MARLTSMEFTWYRPLWNIADSSWTRAACWLPSAAKVEDSEEIWT